METKYIVKESFKRKIRKLDFDSLGVVLEHFVKSKDLSAEEKAPLVNYIHGRSKRLLKKEDYNNPNMTDSEYVAKWGE